MLSQKELNVFFNQTLKPQEIEDYCFNGLQVPGSKDIKKIAFAVSASKFVLEKTVLNNCQALVVHHGFFWEGNLPRYLTINLKNKLKILLENEINLFAFHRPMDIHPLLGNNAQIMKILGIEKKGYLENKQEKEKSWGYWGTITTSSSEAFTSLLEKRIGPIKDKLISNNSISRIGVISGGGGKEISKAPQYNLDTIILGNWDLSHFLLARELNLNVFIMGHHRTEEFGIQALALETKDKLEIETCYIKEKNTLLP